jgi:hypothetical protein
VDLAVLLPVMMILVIKVIINVILLPKMLLFHFSLLTVLISKSLTPLLTKELVIYKLWLNLCSLMLWICQLLTLPLLEEEVDSDHQPRNSLMSSGN